MKTLALIGDSHFDETPGGRFEECVRIHEWIADDLRVRKPDLIVHSGDIFERKSTPRERMAVARFLRSCAETAPVVVVRGNHDQANDLDIFGKLWTDHPITIVETWAELDVAGFHVSALAWPKKSAFLAQSAADGATVLEAEAAAQQALCNVVRGFGAYAGPLPHVLLTHAMVRGSVTSVGQPLVGADFEIGCEDLALSGAHFIALGHIHKPQDWCYAGAPTVYPGSPRRTSFGEVEEKGYVLATFEDVEFTDHARGDAKTPGWGVTWKRIPTPCVDMVLVDGDWRNDLGHFVMTGGPWLVTPACEIRFVYRVPSDEREAAKVVAERLKATWLASGAAVVKVEDEVIATSRARAPEILQARTLNEKLVAMWRYRKVMPEPERAARLLGRVDHLEHEVADG